VPKTRAERSGAARLAFLLALAGTAAGCATAFSPEMVRREIASQTGTEPQRALEFSLGGPTMSLAKSLLARGATDGKYPLAGLDRFEIATYEVPPRAASPAGRATFDVTAVPSRGWDAVFRALDVDRSAVVLVQPLDEATVREMVVLASSGSQVLYARLAGRLSAKLPAAIGESLKGESLESVRGDLMESVGESP